MPLNEELGEEGGFLISLEGKDGSSCATLPSDQREFLTRQTWRRLAFAHEDRDKHLIVAIAESVDPTGVTRATCYSAHHLNNLLMRKHSGGLSHRYSNKKPLISLDPITNREITGEVKYFMVYLAVHGKDKELLREPGGGSPLKRLAGKVGYENVEDSCISAKGRYIGTDHDYVLSPHIRMVFDQNTIAAIRDEEQQAQLQRTFVNSPTVDSDNLSDTEESEADSKKSWAPLYRTPEGSTEHIEADVGVAIDDETTLTRQVTRTPIMAEQSGGMNRAASSNVAAKTARPKSGAARGTKPSPNRNTAPPRPNSASAKKSQTGRAPRIGGIKAESSSRNDIMCPMCTEVLAQPVMLACLHAACQQCVVNRASKFPDAVVCPRCDKETPLNPRGTRGAAALPAHGTLSRRLEKMDLASVICANCKKSVSELFCEQCGSNLCESCTATIHGNPVLSSHEPIRISPDDDDDIPNDGNSCPNHHSKRIQYFCRDDSSLLCTECVDASGHRGHDIVGCGVEKKMLNQHIDAGLRSLHTKMKHCRNERRQIVEDMNHVDKASAQALKVIREHFAMLREALDAREKMLCQELVSLHEVSVRDLGESSAELAQTENNISDASETVERLVAQASGMELLSLKGQILNRLEQAKSDQVPRFSSSKPVYFPRLDPSLAPMIAHHGSVEQRRLLGVFNYEHDFDDQGVFYFLGTQGCQPQQSTYANPHHKNMVKMSASGMGHGYAHMLLDRSKQKCWTRNQKGSWFMVELLRGMELTPSYYTLRHGDSQPEHAVMTWDFQGSQDGEKWVTIRRHRQERALRFGYQSASWAVATSMSFSKFRILMKGPNSSACHDLMLCGLEIYGELHECRHIEPSKFLM